MLQRLFPSLLEASPPLRAVAHRAFAKRDVEHMRWAGNGGWVMPKENPGVRVEPAFVSEAEAAAISSELEEATATYGYPYDGDMRAHLLSDSGAVETTLENVVNNMRVTGRLERPDLGDVVLPPWKYGDDFDASALPPALSSLARKIADCGHFRVGKPRDVTINVRDNSFFQLDPHVDPPLDGPDVFILGLESSVVLTFTPPEDELAAMGQPPRRRVPKDVGMRSWSDKDVDVIFQPRSLVHFTGKARHTWMHAIRAGVQVDGVGEGGGPATCDWWGQTDYLLRRAPRRLSVVFAFGEPDGAGPRNDG